MPSIFCIGLDRSTAWRHEISPPTLYLDIVAIEPNIGLSISPATGLDRARWQARVPYFPSGDDQLATRFEQDTSSPYLRIVSS